MTIEKVPASFWIQVAAALVWNLMGIDAYIVDVTMNQEVLLDLSLAERNLRTATPAWVASAYAVAVFAGLAAAFTLLFRRRTAVPLFSVSLPAVILQMGYIFVGMNAAAVLGPGSIVFPAIIIVLGALQLWFSIYAKNKSWL